MASDRRAAGARRRGLAIAASAAAHGVVFTLLIWRLGSTPQLAATPIMNVELMRLRPARPPAPDAAAQRARRGAGAQAARPQDLASPTSADRPPGAIDEPPQPGRPAGVQQTLRGLLGCQHADLVHLTPQERERCRDREMADAARLRGAVPTRLNLDGHGFAGDPEPYLARRPKDGCKPRAAGDVIAVGPIHLEGVAAGLQCAWSF